MRPSSTLQVGIGQCIAALGPLSGQGCREHVTCSQHRETLGGREGRADRYRQVLGHERGRLQDADSPVDRATAQDGAPPPRSAVDATCLAVLYPARVLLWLREGG